MHRGNRCQLLSALVVCLLHISDGCGRTPARTKTTTTTENSSERTTPASAERNTRLPSNGKLECMEDEVKEAACLNGGTCFVLDLLDTRSAYCECSELWRGIRCEEIDGIFDHVLSADTLQKAGIAVGVIAGVAITIVVIVYCLVKRKKKRKQRSEANGNANGHACKALMDKEKGSHESEEGEKCTDV